MLQEDINEHFRERPLDKPREERMWKTAVPPDFKPVMWESRVKALEGLTPLQIPGLVPVHYAFVYDAENGIRSTSRIAVGQFVAWSLQGLVDFLELDVRLFVGRGIRFRRHPPGSWAIRGSSIASPENSLAFAITVLQDKTPLVPTPVSEKKKESQKSEVGN